MTTPIQKWTAVILVLLLPLFSIAQTQNSYDVALRHLENNKETLSLSIEDLRNHTISDLYSSKHNGVTHVYLKQTHEGIEVFNGIINVNILPNGEVLNMGNRFISNLASLVNTSSPSLSAEDGLNAAMLALEMPKNDASLIVKERINDKHLVFDNSGLSLEPIPVKLVYMPREDKTVRLAWNVTIYELDGKNWWNARVDAQTGELLHKHNQVLHCNFGPTDHNCKAAGHPTPLAQKQQQEKTNLANSYNVFAMPLESPNHGNRSIVTDPADPVASPFGWHDDDGVAGPDYTITRGNNTHTYHDIFNSGASIGDEPDGGATLDFDFPLDLTSNAPYTYVDAAMTNLFYWTNTMHDLWYQYGFDEESGNFQVNNYITNTGMGGDPIFAEGMDGSGTNNANFGTSEDGSTARMQMYIWTSDALPDVNPELIVNSPAAVAGNYPMVLAGFGGSLTATPIIGNLVEVDDATAPTSDACEAIMNGAAISGNIALIDRGDCEFGHKMLKAENEGAIAVIVCNNVATDPIVMGVGAEGGDVTIPGVMISMADCATIRVELANNIEVELGLSSLTIPQPGPSGVTGDFDNGIIAHEYGHGISIRLTGGPSTGACLGNNEQAGEGWSDWFGLVMQTTSSHVGTDRRGIGTYALEEPITGTGIRTYPYSTDMSIDPHTYANINGESIPHGVGSVWCATIWDLYWNLIDLYGFDQDFMKGTGGNNSAMQLVSDGLKLQACNPTFMDARDAILAADQANYGGANICLIWETFARRGMGWGAASGGNEAFDLAPVCLQDLKITKTAPSEIMANEVMTYTFEVKNDKLDAVDNVTITDELPENMTFIAGSSSCGGSEAGGIVTINLGTLASGESRTCTFNVTVADMPATKVHFSDGMENGDGNWTISNGLGTNMWALSTDNPHSGTTSWFAEDPAVQSDQYLDLVDNMSLIGTSNPVLTFWHSYNTELNWDGGVLEITKDGGTTWEDMAAQIYQNGYNGPLTENADSPLSLRDAWHGNSGGYVQSQVDLFPFIDETVTIRFRMGSDAAAGATGWYIDDIKIVEDFYQVTNEACISSDQGDAACSSASTLILEDPTAITEQKPELNMSVYPNPAQDKIFIDINHVVSGKVNFDIYSADGRLVRSESKDAIQATYEVSVDDLSSGLYLIQVKTNQGNGMKKIVVE